MRRLVFFTLAAALAVPASARAQSADVSAQANVLAALDITPSGDLYFGTIPVSTAVTVDPTSTTTGNIGNGTTGPGQYLITGDASGTVFFNGASGLGSTVDLTDGCGTGSNTVTTGLTWAGSADGSSYSTLAVGTNSVALTGGQYYLHVGGDFPGAANTGTYCGTVTVSVSYQ